MNRGKCPYVLWGARLLFKAQACFLPKSNNRNYFPEKMKEKAKLTSSLGLLTKSEMTAEGEEAINPSRKQPR